MKKVLVLGAAGFLAGHLEHRLKADGHFVVSAARSRSGYRESVADEFHHVDLRDGPSVRVLMARHEFDEVFQLAVDAGGLGYIGTGEHDADILTNSVKINLAVLDAARRTNPGKIFFASSQCVYPTLPLDPHAQERVTPNACRETDARFNDNFAFSQEKLYAEALYQAYSRNYGIPVGIGRLGNVYGPYAEWRDPRAKSVAALCRKVALAPYAGSIDVWGSGQQSRSFTFAGDAIEGMIRLMASDYDKPVNIASSQQVTILELLETICRVAGKIVGVRTVEGPIGVSARNSDNSLALKELKWEPLIPLSLGLQKTYPWIEAQVKSNGGP